jgi:hypothetical protein
VATAPATILCWAQAAKIGKERTSRTLHQSSQDPGHKRGNREQSVLQPCRRVWGERVSVEDTKRGEAVSIAKAMRRRGGGGGGCALRVEMRAREEGGGVDIALGDSVDDNGNCREHNAEEHLGVQVVHGLHGPSAHDIVPKLRAGVAHALVE